MRAAGFAVLTGLGGLLCAGVLAQPPATVTFHFEDARMQLAKYTITVHEDGTGHFHAEAGASSPDDTAALPSEGQDRPIQVTAATTQRIFATARAKKLFNIACENGDAHVAFTGRKELGYQGTDGHGGCFFNYSKDPKIQWVTTEMQGIATTLEEGRRLEIEHEHGRLSLDAELETLETMAQNGQALELGNIAPTLLAIVKDDAVMQRAQNRARHLLAIVDAGGIVTK
ncbi:MAG TPA: hypothetical protein VGM02_04395 [Acidobacteriaceae bacterium]|jgi:hypothetical protein